MESRGIVAPSAQIMEKYGVNLPGEIEAIWQPLYHYQTYAAAGALQFTFFQTPIGQGGLTKSDTNMQAAGFIPKGQTFVMTAIQVELLPAFGDIDTASAATFLQDYYEVMSSKANLILEVGSKPYLTQAPLYKFPPAQHIDAMISQTVNATGASFAMGAGQPFQIVPITLTSSQNFNVTINFDSVVAISNDARFGVTLQGYLFRNAQ